jgi:hypothetical protein
MLQFDQEAGKQKYRADQLVLVGYLTDQRLSSNDQY